jgi:ribose transport system substrate-binding protein
VNISKQGVSKTQWLILLFIVAALLISSLYYFYNRKGTDHKVGVVISNLDNNYFVNIALGIGNTLRFQGYEPIVLNSRDNVDLSIMDIKNLVDRGYKVIIYNPIDSNLSVEAVNYANKYGSKVIAIDRKVIGAKVLSTILSNNKQGGAYAGDYILKNLGNHAKILVLQGFIGSSSTKERTESFEKTLRDTGVDIVAMYPADYDRKKSESITYDVLQSNKEINAVFAQNDLMALGAMNAARRAKRKLLIVGYDGIPEMINAIKKGNIAATIQQRPTKMGKIAAQVAMNYLQHEPSKVHSSHNMPVKLITKNNIEEAWGSGKR